MDRYDGHTPGPWKFHQDGWITAGGDDCADVCVAQMDMDNCESSTWGADAHLIAAAPDLLAENARLRRALQDIIAAAPAEAPGYDDWGGDTERAEMWGMNAGYFEAASIARAALQDPDA